MQLTLDYQSVAFNAIPKLLYLQFVIFSTYNRHEGKVYMENIYIIKDRLNEAMVLRSMTAAELSSKTGLNRSSVSRYLSGKSIPRSLAIGKMAQALNVSPAWVLGYDVPMESKETQPTIEVHKLSPENLARLTAYYQALLDSQGDDHANT